MNLHPVKVPEYRALVTSTDTRYSTPGEEVVYRK